MKKTRDICTHESESNIGEYSAVSMPIVQTSSFKFNSYEDFLDIVSDEKNSYMYTRGSNPTTKLIENRLAKLEGGEACKVFSSGMAAITSTLFTMLKSGDHILTIGTIYGQTVSFIKYLSKFNVSYSNIASDEKMDIESAIKENTKVIYIESPSSQHMRLYDLEVISKIAKKNNIITIIDNTWSTAIFQKPIEWGIDIVIHSCSKYIGGSSDVVAGAVISKRDIVDDIFENGHQTLGGVSSPFNSWLLLRSLTTLPIRMKQHDESVRKVIDFLKSDSRIKAIYHPYCSEGKQKELAKKYLSGYSSLLSFELVDNDFNKLIKFVDSFKLFTIGVSWGGFESLILPANKGINHEDLKARGIGESHIRLYVGLEDPESLIDDIKTALDKIYI